MKIKQHIPNACSGLEPAEAEFSNLEELLEIPFVKKFSMNPMPNMGHEPFELFKKYSISIYHDTCDLFMAEYIKDEKLHWDIGHWVVGYLSKDCADILKLPIWSPDDCHS